MVAVAGEDVLAGRVIAHEAGAHRGAEEVGCKQRAACDVVNHHRVSLDRVQAGERLLHDDHLSRLPGRHVERAAACIDVADLAGCKVDARDARSVGHDEQRRAARNQPQDLGRCIEKPRPDGGSRSHVVELDPVLLAVAGEQPPVAQRDHVPRRIDVGERHRLAAEVGLGAARGVPPLRRQWRAGRDEERSLDRAHAERRSGGRVGAARGLGPHRDALSG